MDGTRNAPRGGHMGSRVVRWIPVLLLLGATSLPAAVPAAAQLQPQPHAQTSAWSTATLSEARGVSATVAVGTQVLFAGGVRGPGAYSNVVDIYDALTDQWTTASLSEPESVRATRVGTKALFHLRG